MREHSEKKACRTTSSDPIDALVYSETFKTYPEALKREAEVKRWPRKKKEALIAGNADTVLEVSSHFPMSNERDEEK